MELYLAEAIKRVYKDAKLAIGPSTDSGFYYDFDNIEITNEGLRKIENIRKMIEKEKKQLQV